MSVANPVVHRFALCRPERPMPFLVWNFLLLAEEDDSGCLYAFALMKRHAYEVEFSLISIKGLDLHVFLAVGAWG